MPDQTPNKSKTTMPNPNLAAHILSPRKSAYGHGTLCGLSNDINPYPSIDTAYLAAVEGWRDIHRPCKRCLGVALIAMGVSNDVTE